MIDHVDKQIDKSIFFGQATKTLKFHEEGDTVSVISATWVAEDKLVGCVGKEKYKFIIEKSTEKKLKINF